MFKKIASIFRQKTAPPEPIPVPAPQKVSPTQQPSSDQAITSRWMNSDDDGNPFAISGCDCLAFTQSMISTTTKENVEAYFSFRGDFGQRLIGTLPEDSVQIPCSLQYEYSGEVADGAIFKSKKMEEKWDIYLYESKIYFCRSWSGMLVYVADVKFGEGKVVVSNVYAPRDLVDGDEQYVLSQVDYLKKSHVLGSIEPHPLPKALPRDPEKITAFSFSQYGSKCCFGTYEDTINFKFVRRQRV